ncbi:MAG: TetR/AcrR family transcriptional regulator [Streptococcus gallolyticus]|uniref:TetR/AcrR family transcriptional regulator n=1 Tax=Streptococcus gallolyticus TaxID=315405 RepID=A0A928A9V9_9STRE|nr:TetR/AcrR family transcriptional regulator [Streptococcus gallolyticus]
MTQQRARSKEAIQQRFDDILNRTRELFLEQDYTDISLASVAKELNISRPSLYNYFSSKEELFLALLKHEYLTCNDNFQRTFTQKLPVETFCQQLVHIFYQQPLFIKLLSLHTTALENKCGYEIMAQFKQDTLPFFKTQYHIIQQQFPKATEEDCWTFLQRLTTLSQTFYQYANIPKNQIDIMAKLKTFGSAPLLSPEDYFSKMLVDFASHLK